MALGRGAPDPRGIKKLSHGSKTRGKGTQSSPTPAGGRRTYQQINFHETSSIESLSRRWRGYLSGDGEGRSGDRRSFKASVIKRQTQGPDSLTPNPLSLVRHIHPKEGEGALEAKDQRGKLFHRLVRPYDGQWIGGREGQDGPFYTSSGSR